MKTLALLNTADVQKKRGSRKRTKVNVPNQLILISCKERERREREEREKKKKNRLWRGRVKERKMKRTAFHVSNSCDIPFREVRVEEFCLSKHCRCSKKKRE